MLKTNRGGWQDVRVSKHLKNPYLRRGATTQKSAPRPGHRYTFVHFSGRIPNVEADSGGTLVINERQIQARRLSTPQCLQGRGCGPDALYIVRAAFLGTIRLGFVFAFRAVWSRHFTRRARDGLSSPAVAVDACPLEPVD